MAQKDAQEQGLQNGIGPENKMCPENDGHNLWLGVNWGCEI